MNNEEMDQLIESLRVMLKEFQDKGVPYVFISRMNKEEENVGTYHHAYYVTEDEDSVIDALIMAVLLHRMNTEAFGVHAMGLEMLLTMESMRMADEKGVSVPELVDMLDDEQEYVPPVDKNVWKLGE